MCHLWWKRNTDHIIINRIRICYTVTRKCIMKKVKIINLKCKSSVLILLNYFFWLLVGCEVFNFETLDHVRLSQQSNQPHSNRINWRRPRHRRNTQYSDRVGREQWPESPPSMCTVYDMTNSTSMNLGSVPSNFGTAQCLRMMWSWIAQSSKATWSNGWLFKNWPPLEHFVLITTIRMHLN